MTRTNQACVLLDVSRTISRLHHKVDTGIDRVEHAYIDHIAAHYPSAVALGKLGQEFLLAPLPAFQKLTPLQVEHTRPYMLDRVRFKLSPEQRKVKSLLRAQFGFLSEKAFFHKIDRLPKDKRLFSVGHSRALAPHFRPMADLAVQLSVCIHDLIPMSHPALVRTGTAPKFKAYIDTVIHYADTLFTVSETTALELIKLSSDIAPKVVAPGITTVPPSWNPDDAAPFFLCVGTIEPRKNIGLLLDVWEELAKGLKTPPLLKLVGQSGWADPQLFARIKHLEERGLLSHLTSVSDAELRTLYQRCQALLFPSLAEGFGLPFYEAAAAQIPIIASDIPAFREASKGHVPLLDPNRSADWISAVQNHERFKLTLKTPTWEEHFTKVGL